MNDIKDNQLNEIKSQITEINSAINVSSSTFRLIYDAKNFWVLFLYAGIFSAIIPLFYHILILMYDSHSLIPNYLKIVFFSFIFICWAILMVVRTKISLKTAKDLNMKLNLWNMFKQLLSTKMWIAILPIFIVSIVVLINYSAFFTATKYIAFSGILVGLVLNIIGIMINQKEYSFAGYYMIFSGLAALIFTPFAAHIVFFAIFTPACLIFVISARISSKRQ